MLFSVIEFILALIEVKFLLNKENACAFCVYNKDVAVLLELEVNSAPFITALDIISALPLLESITAAATALSPVVKSSAPRSKLPKSSSLPMSIFTSSTPQLASSIPMVCSSILFILSLLKNLPVFKSSNANLNPDCTAWNSLVLPIASVALLYVVL